MSDTRFGVVGRRLGHSWSPQIHARLGTGPYDVIELEPEELDDFIRNGSWDGLNVTIPYKADAARLADVRSPRVERLGVANTLVRLDDGKIMAENTDVLGFGWMLERFCLQRLGLPSHEALGEKDVVVLGSGGAAQAVRLALESAGARVSLVSRTGEDNYDNLVERHQGCVLLVNTTPVGMYPNCPDSPITQETLSELSGLKGVLDVVYNPMRTKLCLDAERAGIPSESGLAMLVAQALYASELFQGRKLDDGLVEQIESQIRAQTQNVVLIGMPGAGKTTCGKRLARLLGRPFVDIDDAVTTETGRTPAQIISQDGEEAFRVVETQVLSSFCKRSGLVIACGGGVVTQARNLDLVRQNGVIVHVRRSINELSVKGRPLSQNLGVQALAKVRMPLYEAWADITLDCAGTPSADAQKLRGLLGL